jgi:hypothetical protein
MFPVPLISAVVRAGKPAKALICLEDSGDMDNEIQVPRVMRHEKGGRHEAQGDGRKSGRCVEVCIDH